MTTRSPRPRCQSSRRCISGRRCRSRCRRGELGTPPRRARSRSTPASTRSKSCSLVSSATVPPASAAWASPGRAGPGRPQDGRPPPLTAERKSKTLPPVGQGAVEVEGGDIGHRSRPLGPVRRRPAVDGRTRPAGPAGEPGRPSSGLRRGQAVESPAGLGDQGLGVGQAPLREGRPAVVAHAGLGECGQLVGPGHGARSRAVPSGTTRLTRPMARASSAPTARPVRMRSRARPWPISRGSRTVPPSMSGTPKRRQNTPKVALGRGHPQVAPDGQLQAAGHGVALDGGDDRLGERQPGGAHRARPVDGHPVAVPVGQGLEVGSGTEGPAGPGEHGHRRGGSASNAAKASSSASAVAGSTALRRSRPVDGDHGDRARRPT